MIHAPLYLSFPPKLCLPEQIYISYLLVCAIPDPLSPADISEEESRLPESILQSTSEAITLSNCTSQQLCIMYA